MNTILPSENASSPGTVPSLEERRRLDPLGVIEQLARKLCLEDTAKQSEKWEDYWDQAERWLVRAPDDELQKSHRSETTLPAEISPEFAAIATSTNWRLLALLARTFLRPLNELESRSLGYILRTNIVHWVDNSQEAPPTPEKIGELLAQLSSEYSPTFFQLMGTNALSEISIADKSKYWVETLQAAEIADEALSYAEQNSIRRLRDRICAQPEISSLEFRG